MNAQTEYAFNYGDMVHSLDHEGFCDLIKDHNEMLTDALAIEASKIEKIEAGGLTPALRWQGLVEIKKYVNQIVRKGTILKATLQVAQEVFNLNLRLERVTGMRLPIIDLMIECLIASTYHVDPKAIKREVSKTYQADGVPYRLLHLDTKTLTEMNITVSTYLKKVSAERLTTQETGHLNPTQRDILHNLLLMHYMTGQLK